MSKKTDYIHSKIDGLSPSFLNSKIALPNGNMVTFYEYCLGYIPTIMGDDLRINSNEFINDLETLIMIQELDTGINPHEVPSENKTQKNESVSSSRRELISAIKKEYRKDLGKVVDFGRSSITLDEAITELVMHTDANGYVKVSGNAILLPDIIDDLAEKANKTFNLIRADKIKLRATGITSFGINEMAVSLNPNFDMENTYVRYFMETFESALKQTFDPSQVMELSEGVINNLNPKCKDVLTFVDNLTEKYVQDNQIFSDILAEYGESRGVLR